MSAVRPIVLVIEDDSKLRRLLRGTLQQSGLDAREADCGRAGLELAKARTPDLILLDLGLPDVDGIELIRQLRQWWSTRPLIVLSGSDNEPAKIAALESGADDYVTKPFGMPELLARVRAALRRASRSNQAAGEIRARGVAIDLLAREVRRDGSPVELTLNEFRVLALLAKNAGMLVSFEKLVDEIWGPERSANCRHYLRAYVSSLRRKLEPDPARPALILTEAGVGYRLSDEDLESGALQ
jgi:two-component system KDP operon response regulator KdpE